MVSTLILVRRSTAVWPAAMVTPFAALTQLAPSKYSITAPDGVARLSAPTVAVPERKVGVNTTVPVGA